MTHAEPFAVWLTGLPGSGKSAIARELLGLLHARGIDCAHLESDVLRTQLTPFPKYDEAERDRFYASLSFLGTFLVESGQSVIFDATANRRAYRNLPRRAIARFAEVYVDTPPGVCAARDPKGLYVAAREGRIATLPGAQAGYEAPIAPELTVSGANGGAAESARAIVAWLERAGWLSASVRERASAARAS